MPDLALFDFDGTITTGDTWTPFMRLAVRPWRGRAALVVLAPVLVGYELGWLSPSAGRRAATMVGLAGADARRLRDLGVAYADTHIAPHIRRDAMARVDWHRARGDDVVVVTGSLDMYVAPWCRAQGLPLIASQLAERNGRLTGRYAGHDNIRAEKARRVSAQYDLSRYEHVFAYGDSLEDREMIELADRKFYRWQEISAWHEVGDATHPRPVGD